MSDKTLCKQNATYSIKQTSTGTQISNVVHAFNPSQDYTMRPSHKINVCLVICKIFFVKSQIQSNISIRADVGRGLYLNLFGTLTLKEEEKQKQTFDHYLFLPTYTYKHQEQSKEKNVNTIFSPIHGTSTVLTNNYLNISYFLPNFNSIPGQGCLSVVISVVVVILSQGLAQAAGTGLEPATHLRMTFNSRSSFHLAIL